MLDISTILHSSQHRHYSMPKNTWQYYQEWNDALFIHFKVDKTLLQDLIPDGLNIDTHEGQAYIPVVAFRMEKIRPRLLPSVSFISNFYEINVRTYIDMDGKKGVYFLNIEAEKRLSAWVARTLSGLPYEKSTILRTPQSYINHNRTKDYTLQAQFNVDDHITTKSSLDIWLTERYCLYLPQNHEMIRYDIHHVEWPLFQVNCNELKLDYQISNKIHLKDNNVHSLHYSPGVQVLSWQAVKL